MRKLLTRPALSVLAAFVVMSVAAGSAQAQSYKLDENHASFAFKILHAGVSYTHGMFTEATGAFVIDEAAIEKSSFDISIKADSITTGNAKRDTHLRGPDFFSTKEFPALTFKSTKVSNAAGGYMVIGNLTIHGVTKSVTFTLQKLGSTEFPKGVKRSGYSTELTIKRSDFGMTNLKETVGDEVNLMISFEGTVN